MIEPGDFPTRGVAMNDTLLCRAHDDGLGRLQHCHRCAAIAGGDRFLDFAHETAELRAPRFVDFGAARDLSRSLACGTGIGHAFLAVPCSSFLARRSKTRLVVRKRVAYS